MSRKADIEKVSASILIDLEGESHNVTEAIGAAWDAGFLAGLRRAARLAHEARDHGYQFPRTDWDKGWEVGHDAQQRACRDEAKRLAKKGRR